MTRWSQLIVIEHAMADHDVLAVVDDRNFCDFADRENETLPWINHGGETGTSDESLEAGNNSSVFSQRHWTLKTDASSSCWTSVMAGYFSISPKIRSAKKLPYTARHCSSLRP